jgi:hypothetical protein
MSSVWDTLKVDQFSNPEWKTGTGFSKPGIGDRETPWPSFGGRFGGANPTCGICGGRARGGNTCVCEEPAWFIDGEPVEENISAVQMHDNQEWHRQWLTEAFRVLQPGGIAKVFSATRTFHRLAAAMEQVGYGDLKIECWCTGQGFPKSLNVFKAVQALGRSEEEAKPWTGYGTALKPSAEIFVCGRKP